jgi:hypothetical protein
MDFNRCFHMRAGMMPGLTFMLALEIGRCAGLPRHEAAGAPFATPCPLRLVGIGDATPACVWPRIKTMERRRDRLSHPLRHPVYQTEIRLGEWPFISRLQVRTVTSRCDI